jgi:DNA-binding NarL/FixJ family response regulator
MSVSPLEEHSDKIRVILVDDHPLLREGVAQLIQRDDEFTVCGQFEDAPHALEGVLALDPDVVVVDISLKEGTGSASSRI